MLVKLYREGEISFTVLRQVRRELDLEQASLEREVQCWPAEVPMPFLDRADAGRQLAGRLADLAGPAAAVTRSRPAPVTGPGRGTGAGTGAGRGTARELAASVGAAASRPVVLALPRGGVPVALEVARALHAPLDVVLVRKLGVPFQPELAMGAIGEGGVRVLNRQVVEAARVTADQLAMVEAIEREELRRRASVFRDGRPPVPIDGRVVVVVDDGLATGSTARAACQVVRLRGVRTVVLAVPVAPARWTHKLSQVADRLECVESPERFFAIGERYVDFRQTTDEEVIACLQTAGQERR